MHKPTLAAVLLVVALVACSGGDDDTSDDPATTEASTPPSSVTAEPVDPTEPTDSPTTTDPTTTTNTSTTTSTTVPTPTVEEQIAADYQLIYDGYWACLRAPLNCDTSWLVSGGGSEQALINTMQALVDRGRYVGDEDPGYFVIESITVGADGTTAEVVSCWSSTAVLYGPPVDPTRPVGPGQSTDPRRTTLQTAADSWTGCESSNRARLLEGSDPLDEGSETNVCPPSRSGRSTCRNRHAGDFDRSGQCAGWRR